MFWIGLLPAVAVLFFRRNLEEPEVFLQTRRLQEKSGARVRIGEIFERPLLGLTAAASLLAAASLGGNYTILSWLPTYLAESRHLSVLGTGGYLIVNIAGSFCGYLSAAHLSDFLGRRKTFVICAICAAVVVAFYMFAPIGDVATLLLGFPLGFFQSGIVSGMGAAFAEIYPTRVRATGQGFSYNFGRGLGSLIPALVGVIALPLGLNNAIGICAAAAYAVAVIAALMLPETKGKEFTAHD
jgi:predicted MFS family arabinose efflux permease